MKDTNMDEDLIEVVREQLKWREEEEKMAERFDLTP